MEDTPRNLGKEVNRVKLPRPARRAKPWTLLFVGESGRVISIKRFKGFLIALCLLLVVSLAADVILLFFLQKASRRGDALRRNIAVQQERLAGVRKEKERLMAKLAVARSNLEAKDQTAVVLKTRPPIEEPQTAETSAPVNTPETDTVSPETTTDPVQSETTVNGKGLQNPYADTGSISVEEFSIAHKHDDGNLKVHFNIRNISKNRSKPLTGRTYVVLKDDSLQSGNWVVSPRVELVSGRPATGARGQYFAIQFFKPVTYEIKNIHNPERFTRAVVYVYANAEDLLLEKEFTLPGEKETAEP